MNKHSVGEFPQSYIIGNQCIILRSTADVNTDSLEQHFNPNNCYVIVTSYLYMPIMYIDLNLTV